MYRKKHDGVLNPVCYNEAVTLCVSRSELRGGGCRLYGHSKTIDLANCSSTFMGHAVLFFPNYH